MNFQDRGRGCCGRSRWRSGLGLLLMLALTATAVAVEPETFGQGDLVYRRAAAGDWVDQQPPATQWPGDAPGAVDQQWRNWALHLHVDYRSETPSYYYDHAIETTTEALVGSVGKFQIDFNPAFQQLTLHRVELRRDGQWRDRFEPAQVTLARREERFESDMATGMVTALILVSDVRPGDVVRYAYTITGDNPILQDFVHISAPLEWVDPILSRRITIDLPADAEADFRTVGSAPNATIESLPDRKRISWVRERVPAFRPEQDTPSWHPVPATLQIARKHSWADVAGWAITLYPGTPALPADLEQRIASWQELPDVEARVSAALQAIQEEVRYFSVALGDSSHRPAVPEVTWSRRYGDCKDKAWLLSVVLRRLGVEAVPALVNTRIGRLLLEGVPAASQFDHVVVRATIDGTVFWLDPTMSMQRGPLLMRQSSDFDVALPLDAATRDLVPMTEADSVPNVQAVSERLTISEDGASAQFDVVTRARGPIAVARRTEIQSRGITAIGQSYADYYHKTLGELSVATPLVVEDNQDTGELTTRESYRLAKPWFSKGSTERILELRADEIGALLVADSGRERRLPLHLVHPVHASTKLEVVLPGGWRFLDSVGPGKFEDDYFRYRRSSRFEGASLVLAHEYASKADSVPATRVSAHNELKRQAASSTGLRMRVGLPIDTSRRDRQRRLRALLQDAANER